MIFFLLRKELLGPQPIPELDETTETRRHRKLVTRLKTVDFGGQLLFIFGFGLIILAFTWAGTTYPWDSAAVIVPLVLGALLVAAFSIWEHLLAPGSALSGVIPYVRPMIPWRIISTRDILLLFFSEFASGMGMFAVSGTATFSLLSLAISCRFSNTATTIKKRSSTSATYTSSPFWDTDQERQVCNCCIFSRALVVCVSTPHQ